MGILLELVIAHVPMLSCYCMLFGFIFLYCRTTKTFSYLEVYYTH